MSFLETVETRDLKPLLHAMRCDYNKARREFKQKADLYSRQSIGSNYIDEDELAVLLLDCQKKKQDYLKVRDILLQRGEYDFVNSGSYIRDYFARDLQSHIHAESVGTFA